jgi:hypothetical protein
MPCELIGTPDLEVTNWKELDRAEKLFSLKGTAFRPYITPV